MKPTKEQMLFELQSLVQPGQEFDAMVHGIYKKTNVIISIILMVVVIAVCVFIGITIDSTPIAAGIGGACGALVMTGIQSTCYFGISQNTLYIKIPNKDGIIAPIQSIENVRVSKNSFGLCNIRFMYNGTEYKVALHRKDNKEFPYQQQHVDLLINKIVNKA